MHAQKQHQQSNGHSADSPPFPILSSSAEKIGSPSSVVLLPVTKPNEYIRINRLHHNVRFVPRESANPSSSIDFFLPDATENEDVWIGGRGVLKAGLSDFLGCFSLLKISSRDADAEDAVLSDSMAFDGTVDDGTSFALVFFTLAVLIVFSGIVRSTTQYDVSILKRNFC